MKKTRYTLLFLLVSFATFSQSLDAKRANKFFKKKNFEKAIALYQQTEKSKETLENLADAYYFTFQAEKAAQTYEKLFSNYENVDDFYLFKYAQSLKNSGNYEKADNIMYQLTGNNVNTLETFKEIDLNAAFTFKTKAIKANSGNSDFGTAFINNKVVFASGRNKKNATYTWNQEPYLDLYVADVNRFYEFENVQPFSEEINQDKHESSASFSQDGSIMYFDRTRDKKVKINGEKVATIQIFKAEYKDGAWTNIEIVPFSSKNYSTQHPFLSEDGSKLYFSSDMPGSMGSFDIFVVEIAADGSFGEPQNLGPNVNTIYREHFPFFSQENILYFSSNGHPANLGGLDVYFSEMKNGEFSEAKNIGSSINSNHDDFAFAIIEEENIGFFASNRNGSNDDIYGFTRSKNNMQYIVEGLVIDKNDKTPLPNAQIEIQDESGTLIATIEANEEASFEHKLEPGKTYTIKATHELYISNTISVAIDSETQEKQQHIIPLEPYPYKDNRIIEAKDGTLQIELENIYFDFDQWKITARAKPVLDELVQILKEFPKMEIEIASHTDVRGSDAYNFDLSEKRAAATLKYLVKNGIDVRRLRSVGYGESKIINSCTTEAACTDKEHEENRRSEFTILR